MVMAATGWPLGVLGLVFFLALPVVFGLGYPIGSLVRGVFPGVPVEAYLSWLLLLVVLAVSTTALAGRAWQVVPFWAVCCCLVFSAVSFPFSSGLGAQARNDPVTPLVIVLSENVLEAPDVPASAWLRADRELSAGNATARARAAATEDGFNQYLRRRLDCGTPVVIEPPPGTANPAEHRAWQEQQAARQKRMCATLTSPDSPGLTRSLYVAALFALGVAAAPWVEERTRPGEYRRHQLKLVDRGLLLTLIIVAVGALAVL